MRKSYSGNAVATTLGGGVSPTAMILNVGATTGWPDTSVGPFVITIDRGQGSLEEKILISSFSGATLNVETRGWDGTTAQSHSSGAAVVCTLDADSINTHDEVVAGVGSVTPSTSAVGDSAANGSSIFPAAADHKHARESFATGVTAASAPGDARNDGSSVSSARADHKHARESVATLVSDLSPSLLGLPLGLTGAVAPTRYVGGTASGHPTSGTFAQGDFNIDQTGAVWICTAPGSPGTWWSAPLGELGYAQITSPVTGIGAIQDVSGLTVTVTVGSGRKIKVTAFVANIVGGSGTSNYAIFINEGATQLNAAVAVGGSDGVNGSQVTAIARLTPSAGSHTYKVRAQDLNSVSAGTIQCGSTAPAFIMVEDIGTV